MAIITKPLVGKMKNRIGLIQTAGLNGQNIAKALPESYNDKKSDAQLNNRALLTALLKVYQGLKTVADFGWKNRPRVQSAYNAFMSFNQKLLAGTTVSEIDADPSLAGIFDRVKVCAGNTTEMQITSADAVVNATTINVDVDVNISNATMSESAMLHASAYDAVNGRKLGSGVYNLGGAPNGAVIIPYAGNIENQILISVTIVAQGGKFVSDSVNVIA